MNSTRRSKGLAHVLNWPIRERFLPVTHFARFGTSGSLHRVFDVFGKNPAFADKATAQERDVLKMAEGRKMHSIKQNYYFFNCDVKTKLPAGIQQAHPHHVIYNLVEIT